MPHPNLEALKRNAEISIANVKRSGKCPELVSAWESDNPLKNVIVANYALMLHGPGRSGRPAAENILIYLVALSC
jgi:hypothetical protein